MKTIEDLLNENSSNRRQAAQEQKQAEELVCNLKQRIIEAEQDLRAKQEFFWGVTAEQELLVKAEDKDIQGIAKQICKCRMSFIENGFSSIVALLNREELKLLNLSLKSEVENALEVVASMEEYIDIHHCQEHFNAALELSRKNLKKKRIAAEIASAKV